ncbi:MAG: conjugal transfer protein TraD [Pseudomonadota bacterium]|jgi:DNA-binding protein H-NS|uniref:conjugal transfer protein TraD n=1 Tax=unclassified Sphingomonas TaxID=196159 RepID=UPI00053E357E|nr:MULTISPECIES: conjugal transfer protein TraD [unclassified Sphingomonas]
MRKPRDFDAELKALSDKAKLLRDRKLVQLGELVLAAGADALPVEQLAGALLAAAQSSDTSTKEAWRKSGAAFFQRTARGAARGAGRGASGDAASDGSAKPNPAGPRAA